MAPLATHLRRDLERAIVKARSAAEHGAKAAFESLTVHEGKVGNHLSADQRALRIHLRAHARQLGDSLDKKSGRQSITRLIREGAYEHWHRMLFARFLAENDLLIEPDSGIAVSLDEARELAQERGVDPWELASRWAQRMLPQIFRVDDPVLAVALPTESRLELETLLESLPAETFKADDSLGWVYQFWQSAEKDAVNASGKKIGADELPAVTQLFTEPYMVRFLIHNTLGSWWAGKNLTVEDNENAESEEELRKKVALPGIEWDYLRFVKVESSSSCSNQEKRQDAASTSVGFYRKEEPIADLSGNLPHWRQGAVTYFVTFRAADSLPQERIQQWQAEKEQWLAQHPKPWDENATRQYYERFPERLEYWLDQGYGACRLRDSTLRTIVEDALRHFEGERYNLDEFVVTANHVHALVTPKNGHALSDILHSWKSFTGNQINKAIGQSGAFWQKESFDHIVRSPAQLERIRQYIRDHEVESSSSCSNQEKRQDAASTWRPAAGIFDGWPRKAKDIKVLDPCCGSGHFLVELLHHLVPIRMAEEGLTLRDAVHAVLRDNLHGLEIDERCTQIAAFALALTAWKMIGSVVSLPPMHIACSGIGPQASADEWIKLADNASKAWKGIPSHAHEFIRNGLLDLHETFSKAPILGSLIDPADRLSNLITADYETLKPFLDAVFKIESDDDEQRERAVAAKGMADAAEILSGRTFQPLAVKGGKVEAASSRLNENNTRQDAASTMHDGYTLVITNVPYLGRGSHTDEFKSWVDTHYKESKNDLATIFLSRMLRWVGHDENAGTVAAVTPQNWLFLTSYKKLREKLLTQRSWEIVARLGEHAFESSAAAGAFAAMLAISGDKPNDDHIMAGVDVSAHRGQPPIYASAKAALLRGEAANDESTPTHDTADGAVKLVPQLEQLKRANATISLSALPRGPILSEVIYTAKGICTGDYDHFGRYYWEIMTKSDRWSFFRGSVSQTIEYGGRQSVLLWDGGNGEFVSFVRARLGGNTGAWIRGKDSWNRNGIAFSRMARMPVTISNGELSDDNTGVLVVKNSNDLPLLWCFCSSPDFLEAVRTVNQKLSVDNTYLASIEFDRVKWLAVTAEKYPQGLPEPQSNDPTQWLFHGHPAGMVASGPAERSPFGIADPVGTDRHPSLICREPNLADVLQVGVARLLGYRWPAELGRSGFQPLENKVEAASNRLNENTTRQDAAKVETRQDAASTLRLDEASHAWVDRCDELLEFADDDGIVCLSPVHGEASAADRLGSLFATVFPNLWSAHKEQELLQQAANKFNKGNACASIDQWLRERFFEEHCKLFHHRPFIWHIWDGRKDGFNALVNYHKLAWPDGVGRQTLETLTYAYLGDWINLQKKEVEAEMIGAEARLAAALDLQEELKRIIEGEAPYDIFVRWKPLQEQAIGWEPDINDGVRLNIRPFLLANNVGRKGAGILRRKPNIKWKKDRGKEPKKLRPRDEYPWFWRCDPEGQREDQTDFKGGAEFDGARWNDLHYTIECKQAAREQILEEV